MVKIICKKTCSGDWGSHFFRATSFSSIWELWEWYVNEILLYQKYSFKTVYCNLYSGYRSLWESDQTPSPHPQGMHTNMYTKILHVTSRSPLTLIKHSYFKERCLQCGKWMLHIYLAFLIWILLNNLHASKY